MNNIKIVHKMNKIININKYCLQMKQMYPRGI